MIQAIMAGAQIIPQLIGAFRQNKLANKINPVREDYQESNYAKNFYGTANQLFNARMPGAVQAGQNIQGNLGRAVEGIERNASDSSSALAALTGAVANSNESMVNLGIQEGQNKMQAASILGNASEQMTREHQKVYEDRMAKYNEQVAAKAALRQSASQNLSNAFGNIAGLGGLIGNLGGAGKSISANASPLTQGPVNLAGGWRPTALSMTPSNLFIPGITPLPARGVNPLTGLPQ